MKKLKLEDAQRMSHEEAKSLDLMRELEGDWGDVLYVDGHLTIDGDYESDRPQPALVVRGNLTIKGSLINRDGDSAEPVIVGGDLKAKNIIAGGSEIVVLGSANIANTVYGHYNHGELRIRGDLRAKAWISHEHSMSADGHLIAATGGSWGDFLFEDSKAFAKGLVADGSVDHAALIAHILNNKSPLKSGAKPPRLVVLEELARLQEEGGVVALDLREKPISGFPEVLGTLGLERLELKTYPVTSKAYPSGLTAEVGSLQSLKELYLDGWSHVPYPEELWSLSGLEVLHLPLSDQEVCDGISGLVSLEVLNAEGNVHMPSDLGELPRLRQLDITGNHRFMTTLPPIAAVETLELLIAANQKFESIPDLSALKRLHTLVLSGALECVEGTVDLTQLPALRRLGWNWSSRSRTITTPPKPALLECVRGLEQLEVLHLAGWAPDVSFADDIFAGMSQLRELSLQACRLEKLPESIFDLDLETLDLDRNSLPESELARVRERWPNLNEFCTSFRVYGHRRRAVPAWGEDATNARLAWSHLVLPEGTSATARVCGVKANGKPMKWIELGVLDPGTQELPLYETLVAAKQGETQRLNAEICLFAHRGDGPTSYPSVGRFTIEMT